MARKDPEADREYQRRWKDQHREQQSEYHQAYRAAHSEKIREYKLDHRQRRTKTEFFRRHRLRPEDWAAMWEAQCGNCYLCGKPFADASSLHVDHDHRHCGKGESCSVCRRGLACNNCNASIGLAGDDPDRLRRMADALEAAQMAVTNRLAAAHEQLTFDTEMLAN